MWEQVKWAMVESAKEVFGSVRVEGKNPKSAWWNDEIKAAVEERCWQLVVRRQKKNVYNCT